ncbi:MAG: hypothetical protein ACLP29_02890 [Dissulfurispiraceae bacterium]
MRKTAVIIITFLLLTSCTCLLKSSEVCKDEKYGPTEIRLSEFSRQVVYYYHAKKQVIPANFDENQYVQVLRQLPSDQVDQKDVDSMVATFKMTAHAINDGFSVMLCDNPDKKIMEDFANHPSSPCRFDLKTVEIKSWNENNPCTFEMDWRKYCSPPSQ